MTDQKLNNEADTEAFTQETALAFLKEAKENGTLNEAIEAELAELIGTKARPEIEGVLKTTVTHHSRYHHIFEDMA